MMSTVFQPNASGLARLDATLRAAGDEAIAVAGHALRACGEEYRRRLAAASPVGIGDLAESWQVIVEQTERGVSVTVGTNLRGKDGAPYPVFLELGTARIAGGRVAAWEPGEPTIADWPAKSRADGKQPPAGANVQMPLVRPIGYEIARSAMEELRVVIAEAFRQKLSGGTF